MGEGHRRGSTWLLLLGTYSRPSQEPNKMGFKFSQPFSRSHFLVWPVLVSGCFCPAPGGLLSAFCSILPQDGQGTVPLERQDTHLPLLQSRPQQEEDDHHGRQGRFARRGRHRPHDQAAGRRVVGHRRAVVREAPRGGGPEGRAGRRPAVPRGPSPGHLLHPEAAQAAQGEDPPARLGISRGAQQGGG